MSELMRSVIVTGPGTTAVVEVPVPRPGPADVLVRIRACGICGSDGYYVSRGGIPPREGATPLGHEPAGEVVEVGADVRGIAVGDRVVVNPIAPGSGRMGSGGPSGGLSEYVLVEGAAAGRNVAVVPPDLPFDIAALTEPMSVARHGVNRTRPRRGDRVVVFGAGPIGLGAVIGYGLAGAASVVVVDVVASRLAKALAVGADAVIDSSRQDVVEELTALHGAGTTATGRPRVGTDIYLDAAGVPAVVDTALGAAKQGATLGIVGVHKKPVPVDFGAILGAEVTITTAMGYPDEFFAVAQEVADHRDRFAIIVSDRFTHTEVEAALTAAVTPGRADKVIVTLG
jgi:2-desacetyl-2-hydroxyethyl bacteriochlorophyllide A dehydrogenase